IDEAFTFFKTNNIDDLIIDLRYNPGGSVTTASILLDKIAGHNDGKLQMTLKWNNNFSKFNEEYHFENDENSLNLKRVFFLTTSNTASASELVINALKPYMDVVIIGDNTSGKPVGMAGRKHQGLIYWLINFSIYNSQNNGDYFYGLYPNCSVSDSYEYSRTDKRDPLLSKALHYVDNDNCY
ncbi:MAG: S41 family peptidase, partial [Campylobacterales bacterium]|nr:S41 family peptidase [Campylobacterales bacterium]